MESGRIDIEETLDLDRGGEMTGERPSIESTKDGPYDVVGGPEFIDPAGNTPESAEHYTLCRCGQPKNKPFCNGQHWYVNFKDPVE